jgi:hypothetical protein
MGITGAGEGVAADVDRNGGQMGDEILVDLFGSQCRTAWRILRFRFAERALDAVVGFLFAGLWGSACS